MLVGELSPAGKERLHGRLYSCKARYVDIALQGEGSMVGDKVHCSFSIWPWPLHNGLHVNEKTHNVKQHEMNYKCSWNQRSFSGRGSDHDSGPL